MWYRQALEYYSAMKKKGVLPLAITRMNLEDNVLSEINKTGKILHDLTYMCILNKSNSQRVEWWLPGAEGWGSGDMLVKEHPFLVR